MMIKTIKTMKIKGLEKLRLLPGAPDVAPAFRNTKDGDTSFMFDEGWQDYFKT
jgi:hypothetical protein